ncbi:acyl carrier protein [Lysinibacillus capsici]|uniref:acyl carrier protein n=1 Tax=Lysinibacillus capsici TaxID=2115968 RepID=UPI001C1050EB|nr:acyl carrier protein [Lysinibacillus capsici]MBU5253542.1 acyl carrier protein [Lysinibacillus capsici]MCR6523202.1 acyl carrier protein [Lysinibacillus capsici]MDP1393422.1 acyl carrier protein [Lysinibacillus capsici]MDP1413896.1 acyl carrier protein [Lysinibacillus capsici]MDP1429166.1 acyl carrier protein [Lysinibacillus capsici]
MDIREYVLTSLQEKHEIEKHENLDELNYVEEGYVDSFGLVQFVFDLEEQFNITFSDEEMMSKDFQIVGKLIQLIEDKLSNL